MCVVLFGSKSDLVMSADQKVFYHSNDRGCSDTEELAKEEIKYLERGFLQYLGAYCNTIIMKSIRKVEAKN